MGHDAVVPADLFSGLDPIRIRAPAKTDIDSDAVEFSIGLLGLAAFRDHMRVTASFLAATVDRFYILWRNVCEECRSVLHISSRSALRGLPTH
jgi:hypothetical protein